MRRAFLAHTPPVSYRDDRDADQARIEALEGDLASAQRRIAELEGKQSLALVPVSGSALAVVEGKVPWYGSPLRIDLTRTFDGAYPTDAFEELIDIAREITGDSGRSEVLKSSLSWKSDSNQKGVGPFLNLTVSVRDGRTVVTLHDRLGGLAGAYWGGVGGGVGGGAISAPIMLPIAAGAPALIPVFVLGWLGAIFVGVRSLYKRSAKKRAVHMQKLFDAICIAVEAKLP